MRAFLEIFKLELRRLWRSGAIALLLAASLAWMFAVPRIVSGDGTPEGTAQVTLQWALGGAFALCCIALGASCACSLSRERDEHRLPLAMVRPTRTTLLALGRIAANTLAGAFVLAACCGAALCVSGGSRRCSHVLNPVMDAPGVEAEKMYRRYSEMLPKLADPTIAPELRETLEAMKKTPKPILMRMFTQRARDRYQAVATNSAASWRFPPVPAAASGGLAVRLRFSSDFNMRNTVKGELAFGSARAAIDGITRSLFTVALENDGGAHIPPPDGELVLTNTGDYSLMLRPRMDVKLLVAADSFAWNLMRAFFQLVAILAAICAFAMFLGSFLGRTVAIFTCFVMLFSGAISSDVIESYPDQLESDNIDHISLAVTRSVELVSRPLSALNPISSLAADECIEPRQTAFVAIFDGLALPLAFSLLAAFAMVRRTS